MRYKLSHLPLLKIVLPLIAGILCFNFQEVPFSSLLVFAILLLLGLIISHFTIKNSFSKTLNAVIVYAFVFTIGGLMITSKKFSNQQNHFSLYNATFAKGIISKPLEEKEKTFKTLLTVLKLKKQRAEICWCIFKKIARLQIWKLATK